MDAPINLLGELLPKLKACGHDIVAPVLFFTCAVAAIIAKVSCGWVGWLSGVCVASPFIATWACFLGAMKSYDTIDKTYKDAQTIKEVMGTIMTEVCRNTKLLTRLGTEVNRLGTGVNHLGTEVQGNSKLLTKIATRLNINLSDGNPSEDIEEVLDDDELRLEPHIPVGLIGVAACLHTDITASCGGATIMLMQKRNFVYYNGK